MTKKKRITDEQIRALCRADRTLLDTLMMAIHSQDRALRDSARAYFAALADRNKKVAL